MSESLIVSLYLFKRINLYITRHFIQSVTWSGHKEPHTEGVWHVIQKAAHPTHNLAVCAGAALKKMSIRITQDSRYVETCFHHVHVLPKVFSVSHHAGCSIHWGVVIATNQLTLPKTRKTCFKNLSFSLTFASWCSHPHPRRRPSCSAPASSRHTQHRSHNYRVKSYRQSLKQNMHLDS